MKKRGTMEATTDIPPDNPMRPANRTGGAAYTKYPNADKFNFKNKRT